MNPADVLLTVHQAALMYSVPENTIAAWIKGGSLKVVNLPHQGRLPFVVRNEMEKLVFGK